jgi:hypothetical protein
MAVGSNFAIFTPHAGVAQLVERLLPKTTRLQRSASCMEQVTKLPELDGLTRCALSGGNPYDSGSFQLTSLRHI